MNATENISTPEKLEFAIFCIENVALLQKKYADVISCFARKENISLDQAMDIFYRSEVYRLIREGVSDMHCMSREYLAEELDEAYRR